MPPLWRASLAGASAGRRRRHQADAPRPRADVAQKAPGVGQLRPVGVVLDADQVEPQFVGEHREFHRVPNGSCRFRLRARTHHRPTAAGAWPVSVTARQGRRAHTLGTWAGRY